MIPSGVASRLLCINSTSCVSSCVWLTVSKTLVWLTAILQAPAIGSLESYKFRPVSCRWAVRSWGCRVAPEQNPAVWTAFVQYFGGQLSKSDVWSTSPVSLYPSSLLRARARLWNVNSSCWPCWNNGRQLEGFFKPQSLEIAIPFDEHILGGHNEERSMGRPLVLFIISSQHVYNWRWNMWGSAKKGGTAEFSEVCCRSLGRWSLSQVMWL